MWLGILAGIFLFVCFSGIFMVCNDHRINDMSAKEFWLTELVIAIFVIVGLLLYK